MASESYATTLSKAQIAACDRCQRVGYMKTVSPDLQPIEINGCWEVLGMDLIGPFAETRAGMKYVCTMTDLFSKFVYAEPIVSKEAASIACVLRNMAYLYGPPKWIITDQGREFNNELITCVFKSLGIIHSVTSAYHHQAKGQNASTNQSVKRGLMKYTNDTQTDWDEHVKHVVYSINTSFQRTTKHTPYEILFARKHHTVTILNRLNDADDEEDRPIMVAEAVDLDSHVEKALVKTAEINAKIKGNIAASQAKQKEYSKRKQKGAKSFKLAVGDKVLQHYFAATQAPTPPGSAAIQASTPPGSAAPQAPTPPGSAAPQAPTPPGSAATQDPTTPGSAATNAPTLRATKIPAPKLLKRKRDP